MTNEEYYLLFNTEDGIGIKHFESTEKLKEYIEENYPPEDCIIKPVFLDKMPPERDGYFDMTNVGIKENEKGLIIIKGRITVPKPIKVVTKYDME